MIKKSSNYLILITILLSGCIMSAGTHGSVKGYEYQTTKSKLESAVIRAIELNDNIERESQDKVSYIHETNQGKKDTVYDNYYNDGNYLTIKIKTQKGHCEYTFRYYGGEEYWKSSPKSKIFICWAYAEDLEGVSQASAGTQTLKYLTDVFESELIKDIDKILNLTHQETE